MQSNNVHNQKKIMSKLIIKHLSQTKWCFKNIQEANVVGFVMSSICIGQRYLRPVMTVTYFIKIKVYKCDKFSNTRVLIYCTQQTRSARNEGEGRSPLKVRADVKFKLTYLDLYGSVNAEHVLTHIISNDVIKLQKVKNQYLLF